MAPPTFSPGDTNGSLSSGPRYGLDERDDDGDLDGTTEEMAMLEGTYEETTIPAGPEVEAFARLLDESSMFRGAGTADAKARILKLVDNYHRYVSEKCRQLRSRTSPRRGQKSWQRSARDDASNQDSNNDMDLDDLEDEALTPRETEEVRRWEAEMQTWDLLRRILPLRYTEQGKAKPVGRSETAPTTNAYWDEFLLSDTLALERKHVLSWLQSNAETGPDIGDLVRELQQRADRGDIVSHGWLHTRSAIKLHKNVTGWPHVLEQDAEIASGSQAKANPTPLITQLDPDAKTRQNRRLDVKDEYFEKAIWVGCFELLRRGRSMAEIRDWCSERTEIWRAVCMSALPLSKDDSEAVAPYDPAAVILWRRICYALARQGGTDDFERAVYGILSGDVLSVDKVCKTWDDLMFANYNALLRTQFDTYLIGRARPEASAFSIQTFPAFNAVQFHGDAGSVAERLVRAVEADVRVKGTLTPLKVLQGALIANSFDQFAYNLGIVLAKQITDPAESKLIPDFGLSADGIERSKCMDINDYDGLRIVIHVLIAIQSLEGGASSAQGGAAATRRQVQENIISAYITFLRLAGLYELIPLYASRLVGPRAYYTLSKNLIHLEDQESRKTQLSLIQRMGLDVRKFVAFQPNVYLSDLPESDTLPGKAAFKILTKTSPTSRFGHKIIPDFFGEDPDSVERADEDLIRSLEWLLLVPDSWSEAFHFATEAYKYFLKTGHLNAARYLASRVPCAEIVSRCAGIPVRDHSDPSWFTDLESNELLETMTGAEMVPAKRVVAEARSVWEMECLVQALDSMETMSSFMELINEQPTGRDREFYAEMGKTVKLVKAYTKPLLRNWLLVSEEEDADFEELRLTYLPETVLAFTNILQFAGQTLSRDNLLECMELAAEIADKDSDVSALFVKVGRMKELVAAFASCSKALAAASGEKKAPGVSSKKMREMGWSRELWSVGP